MGMEHNPKLISGIKNDIGIFLCLWGPISFSILSVFLFIKSTVNNEQYANYEIVYISLIIFISISLCLWPFILWWWYQIIKTFKHGVVLDADSENMNLKYVIGMGLKYKFNYNGAEIEHVASLVSNKKMKRISNEPVLSIVYNPNKNISFVRDVYT
jgi:hypothetical protein